MSDNIRWTVNIDGIWDKSLLSEVYTIRVIQWKRGLVGFKKKPGWVWDYVGKGVLGDDGWEWEWWKKPFIRSYGSIRGVSKTLEEGLVKGRKGLKWMNGRPPQIFKEYLEGRLPSSQEIMDDMMQSELPI